MRDVNRINETLEKLRVLWELCPDLRFGQLLDWIRFIGGGTQSSTFYWEEDRWNEAIQKCIVIALNKEDK